MTIHQVPVWELFPTRVQATTDPTTLAELFALLNVTDATDEEQLPALFDYIDSPLWLSASIILMDEVDVFLYAHVKIDGSYVQAVFDESEERDASGKWVGNGVSFAKTQARVRLQILGNQARTMSGLNKNAPVMIAINKVPQGSTTPPYSKDEHSASKETHHWEDMPTASDNDAVKTEGAIVYIQVTGTKDNFVGWMGTGSVAPVLLSMNGVDLYNKDGTPAEGAPLVPTVIPGGKVPGAPKPQGISKKVEGDHTGLNLSIPGVYDREAAVASAREVGQKIVDAQLLVTKGTSSSSQDFVDAGKLKANVAATIAAKMGDKYDAQIMPEVRVPGDPNGATYAEKSFSTKSASELFTKNDVWEKYNAPDSTTRYKYVGTLGQTVVGRTYENGGIQNVETVVTLGPKALGLGKTGVRTNITGDTPEVAQAQREEGVSSLVHLWAQSSNDEHPVSLAVQNSAVKEFGLPDTKAWGKGGSLMKNAIVQVEAAKGEALQAFLRAQYDATQEFFKAQGITAVTLFRGFKSSSTALKANSGDQVKVQMRPLSSFSYSRQQANKFGGGGPNKVLIVGVIPIENILSTSLTGVGCQSEAEVVVIGGKNIYTLDARAGGY